jgi:hypothetical protein
VGIDACTNTPVTKGIVTFDATAFKTAFPAFASVPDAILAANFQFATLMLQNSCCSVVEDAPTRAVLYQLAVCHITALLNGVNGEPPSGVVGRISNATEGSVSATTEMMTQSESAAYWNQTQWGAMYWRMTAQYRTARYVPPCGPQGFSPWDAWPQ